MYLPRRPFLDRYFEEKYSRRIRRIPAVFSSAKKSSSSSTATAHCSFPPFLHSRRLWFVAVFLWRSLPNLAIKQLLSDGCANTWCACPLRKLQCLTSGEESLLVVAKSSLALHHRILLCHQNLAWELYEHLLLQALSIKCRHLQVGIPGRHPADVPVIVRCANCSRQDHLLPSEHSLCCFKSQFLNLLWNVICLSWLQSKTSSGGF